MKRLPTLFLCLLLLAGCAPEEAPAPQLQQRPTVEDLASAVLDACGRSPDELERTDQLLDEAGLSAYLTGYYGLEEGSWQDCAIYRAGGAQAFEIAVVELTPDADMESALSGLNAYVQAREGDFTGYAPEQAALVHQSYADGAEIALAGAEDALTDSALWARFAALFICETPSEARSAFLRCLDPEVLPSPAAPDPAQTWEEPSPSPSQAESPSPAADSASPEPTTDLSPQPAPDGPSPEPSVPAAPSDPSPALPSPSPVPSPDPSPEPSSPSPVTYPGRVDYLQPGIDDMTIYDTSDILAAWESGDPSSLSNRDREVYDVCCQVLAELVSDGMSDYDKELAVYRWLISHATYDEDHYDTVTGTDPTSYTPYGVLIYSKGVCLGFSTTFQLFMDLCDVECITVVGAAFLSQSDHAWNMVRLNGQWYCVDVTWDLNSRRLSYFNVTSDYMARTDHQWDYSTVPEATASDGGKSAA